jgi:ethanolamine permease
MGEQPQPPGLHLDQLLPEERAYVARHALKKPLRVRDIWALGVGGVIAGMYFGWNLGLGDGNGAVAMLIASLIICLLYLCWVLTLSELSVALPFAGGPLAYGRRTSGPTLGFLMGWSMVLECQFAAIATVLAIGGYVAFLINPDNPDPDIKVFASLAALVIFFLLHAWGVKEQSTAMTWMTVAAIVGLAIFFVAAASHFSWHRIWTNPLLPEEKGWKAVLDAVPYALWWLVIIEAVALAAEETVEPHRTIPRGIVWAQLTLILLVLLTWLFACGAVDDSQELAQTLVLDAAGEPILDDEGNPKTEDVEYPLAKVISRIPAGKSPFLTYGFGIIALFGLIASYHGMLFGVSRQAFALGRAGYLPRFLGEVHAVRRTPVPALAVSTLIASGFVVGGCWYKHAIDVAVLVSTLTALVWYILAMVCLWVLRRREAELFKTYNAPLYHSLPIVVVLLSVFSLTLYSVIQRQVIPFTLLLYAGGIGYFLLWARKRIESAAPEELASRGLIE